MPEVVLVCGSVEWRDPEPIEARLRLFGRGTIIVHGKARGADEIADAIADRLGFERRPYPVDWRPTPDTPARRIKVGKHGPYDSAAGMIRNAAMFDEQEAKGEPVTLVLAYRIDGSSGTTNTISHAKRRGVPYEVTDL